ncbi:MAG: NlpC/P60 family protein [Vulcanimicrobiota bacterium]
MSIRAVTNAPLIQTDSPAQPGLPQLRLAHYTPAQSQSPRRADATNLVGRFLDHEVEAAGFLGFGSKNTLSDRVYRAALDAPSSVTYKDGRAHVFGDQTWTDGTRKGNYPGYNSCARVASAILRKGGVKTGIHDTVVGLEGTLQGKGWKKVDVDDIRKGDVVIWKHNQTGANHVGIYVGNRLNLHRGFGQTTVDNFSFTGEPEFRALHRETEWNWAIRKVLRAPGD